MSKDESQQLSLFDDSKHARSARALDNDISAQRQTHTIATSAWESMTPAKGIYTQSDCYAAIVKRDAAGTIIYTLPYNPRMLAARAQRIKTGSGESFPDWLRKDYAL
jgi:hypothetical protein